ncbi:MAG: hypothetical protein U9Q73_01920 [Nanoarchaeota archaeon]|nr:hypothetical protein [Nanoarchaeota archaeon]
MVKEKKEKEGYYRTRHGKKEWVSKHSQTYNVKNPRITQKAKSKVMSGAAKQLIDQNPDVLSLETEAEIIKLLDQGYGLEEIEKLAEGEMSEIQEIQEKREEGAEDSNLESSALKKLSKTTKVELFFESK